MSTMTAIKKMFPAEPISVKIFWNKLIKKFFPKRIRALSQFAKNNQTLYEWNGTEWIAIQGPTSTNEENN